MLGLVLRGEMKAMKKSIDYFAMSGQWLAVFLFLLGIIIEIRYMADIGFLCITIGACVFSGFTKVRELYYKSLTDKKSKLRWRKRK